MRSSEVPQVLSQLLPRAVDVGLHRAQRELYDFRDLVVRIVLDVPQYDAGAILGAEFGDRSFDCRSEFTRLELFEGRLTPAGHGHRGRARALGRDRIGRTLDADGVHLSAPQMIDGDV